MFGDFTVNVAEWGVRWLQEPPYTLKDFLWAKQPEAHKKVISYLKVWKQYALDVSEADKYYGVETPPPIIHLYGPNNTGKTEIVGRGIARFFMNNLGFNSFQYIHWASYVRAKLGNKPLEINLNAYVLILDDFDGARPVPKSLSTWMLDDMTAFIKNRKFPMILISNRKPDQLRLYLSTPVEGPTTEEVIQSAMTVLTSISRKMHTGIEFIGGKNIMNIVEQNRSLREQARAQDFYNLGFPKTLNEKEAIY